MPTKHRFDTSTQVVNLAEILKASREDLEMLSFSVDSHYRTFRIPKRSSGYRIINAPTDRLRIVQRAILDEILIRKRVHRAAKAYVPGKGTRENARFHIGQAMLAKADISNFFGSITADKVLAQFQDLGYNAVDALLLTRLCTLKGFLPQGAPSSGYLSNLALREFDRSVMMFARTNGLRYTRYADDIFVSGDRFEHQRLFDLLAAELKTLGLRLNRRKCCLIENSARQVVTGLVVNSHVSPGREFLRQIRMEIHYLKLFGPRVQASKQGFRSTTRYLENLRGRISYARQMLTASKFPSEWKHTIEDNSIAKKRTV